MAMRRRSSSELEAGRKFMRWGVAALVVVVCARQGLLAFSASASVNIGLSEGLWLDAEDSLPTTNNCNSTVALPNSLVRLAEPRTPSSCTDYRSYPVPEHQSGLPYLADVFATRDRQYLLFIGLNRGICSEEFLKQDGWMDDDNRFMCVFPGNTIVISEYVAPTGKVYRNNYMFRCKIPEEFQHLVVPGQENTNLHVDLHSIHNPEGWKKGMRKTPWFESQKITDTPKIDQIPVCHAGYADLNKQYELVAYTRVQSTYRTQVDKQGRSFERSTIHRIEEWIEWHQSQGFDHFIIYDNDPEPHGPIEKLTKPFVESGLVTYRWFPLKDCRILKGKKKGNIKRFGQAAGGLSAMHRLTDQGAKYLAHMDVDEFFVIYYDGETVLDYVKKALSPGSAVDVLQWMPTVLEHCDGTTVESEKDSPMETKQCWTRSHASDVKLIMRMDTMLHFQVHFPLTTKDWNKPRVIKVPFDPKKGVGFLAHYRGEIEPGLKENTKRDRLPYFDKFIAERRKRKGLPPLEAKSVVRPSGGKSEGKEEAEEEETNEEETTEGEEEETNEGEEDENAEGEETDGNEAEGEADGDAEADNKPEDEEGEENKENSDNEPADEETEGAANEDGEGEGDDEPKVSTKKKRRKTRRKKE